MKLTKNYWVLHQNGAIFNKDYQAIQTGECYVGFGLEAAEFDTLIELMQYVEENKLEYTVKEKGLMNYV